MQKRGHALSVLIIDGDAERASDLARLVRLSGCAPQVAGSCAAALAAVGGADVVIVDDDTCKDALAFLKGCARAQPHVYRCASVAWSRFAAVRGAADYVLVKPFGSAALTDALAAAVTPMTRQARAEQAARL